MGILIGNGLFCYDFRIYLGNAFEVCSKSMTNFRNRLIFQLTKFGHSEVILGTTFICSEDVIFLA